MSNATTTSTGNPLILTLLLDQGIISQSQLVSVRDAQLKDGRTLEESIISLGIATEQEIAEQYSRYLAVPCYEPRPSDPPPEPVLAELLSEKFCRDQLAVPIRTRGDTLELAFVTPNELLIIDEVQLLTGYTIRPLITTLSIAEARINALYHGGDWTTNDSAGGAAVGGFAQMEAEEASEELESDEPEEEGVLHLDQRLPPGRDGRIIRIVNHLLEQAVNLGASDIHLEPFEKSCAVRFRMDGVLHEVAPPPYTLFVPIVSRIKVLSKMDIAEKRIPQDGAIALKSQDRRVDLRVNTMPTVYGEKVVLRVLDKTAIPDRLTMLGLEEKQAFDVEQSIRMPHGLMLVTGPTGSGKSTTLYTCLNMMNGPERNICTVEDPVEYKFKGINQVQIKSQIGMTFASALRAFLRQDPDVIMVGEVRDGETAEICMRAALTGHLVISTLHTNDALSAITRLQDMGIEPFMLGSTLRMLQAQRLIRRLCEECRQPYDCSPENAKAYGLEEGHRLYKPVGCDACRGMGYKGRVGIFEVVRMSSTLASMVQARKRLPEIRDAARAEGFKLLFDSALEKAKLGVTSLEEALSVTIAGDD